MKRRKFLSGIPLGALATGAVAKGLIASPARAAASPAAPVAKELTVEDVRKRSAFKTPLAIYSDHHSVWQGGELNLFAAANLTAKPSKIATIEIFRLGQEKAAKTIPLTPPLVLKNQECSTFRDEGCSFSTNWKLKTENLEPGPYFLIAKNEAGESSNEAFFAVLPKKKDLKKYSVAVMFPTFTWAAYNEAGGRSTYYPGREDGLEVVSLKRPLLNDPIHGHQNFAEMYKATEKIDPKTFAITSEDLQLYPELLQHLEVLVLTGHDEYYSQEMRVNLDKAIEKGMNVGIFAGNVMWWKINYRYPNIFVYKGNLPPPENLAAEFKSTGNFYALNEPEETTIGMSYRFAGYPLNYYISPSATFREFQVFGLTKEDHHRSRGIEVANPSHPVFAGTDLKLGELFGIESEALGYEIDGLPLEKFSPEGIDRKMAPFAPKGAKILTKGLVYNMFTFARSPIVRAATGIEFKKGRGTVIHMGSANWFRIFAAKDAKSARVYANTVRYLKAKAGGALS